MDKKEALGIVLKCAKQYHDNLAGRIIMFECEDKKGNKEYMEMHFEADTFLHLTGCKVNNLSAKAFYRKCLSGRLSPDDFDTSEDGTTALKLRVLPLLMEKDLSAKMIGDYDARQPRLYTDKLAGNIRGCIGFKEVAHGKFVPNTVPNADIRKHALNTKKLLQYIVKRKVLPNITKYDFTKKVH